MGDDVGGDVVGDVGGAVGGQGVAGGFGHGAVGLAGEDKHGVAFGGVDECVGVVDLDVVEVFAEVEPRAEACFLAGLHHGKVHYSRMASGFEPCV